MTTPPIRRQVYDLTPADLERHAAWEFALDEEGVEGQDEATVRPCEAGAPIDPAGGMFIVRAWMTLADGTRHVGYLTPSAAGGADLKYLVGVLLACNVLMLVCAGIGTFEPSFVGDCFGAAGRPHFVP